MLTVVQAPQGRGKTTILVHLLKQRLAEYDLVMLFARKPDDMALLKTTFPDAVVFGNTDMVRPNNNTDKGQFDMCAQVLFHMGGVRCLVAFDDVTSTTRNLESLRNCRHVDVITTIGTGYELSAAQRKRIDRVYCVASPAGEDTRSTLFPMVSPQQFAELREGLVVHDKASWTVRTHYLPRDDGQSVSGPLSGKLRARQFLAYVHDILAADNLDPAGKAMDLAALVANARPLPGRVVPLLEAKANEAEEETMDLGAASPAPSVTDLQFAELMRPEASAKHASVARLLRSIADLLDE